MSSQLLLNNDGTKRILGDVKKRLDRKSDLKHPHVTSVIPDLPVGAITKAAWIDDIVTDYWGNVWLKCDGREIDIEEYPELVGLGISMEDIDIVPNLTSLSSHPPFKASSSGIYNTSYNDWHMFTNDTSKIWISPNNSFNASGIGEAWVKIDAGSPILISKYFMKYRGSGSISECWPVDWTFEVSNDDSDWVILDDVLNKQAPAVLYQSHEKILNTSNKYRYYKLRITKVSGMPSASWRCVVLGQLQICTKGCSLKNTPLVDGQYTYVKANNRGFKHEIE